MKATLWLFVATIAGTAFAHSNSVDGLKLRGEEVLKKSLLEGNGATCVVTEGNYGDVVTEGNYADVVTEGNYGDVVTAGNYGSPLGLAAKQMEEIDSSAQLPSPR
jgi:hypothetical protein